MDKIVCIGKNYDEHVQELGGNKNEKPVIFLKPPSILRRAENREDLTLKLPQNEGAIHYECEIVLQITGSGYRLNVDESQKRISAVSVGLDITKRDLQTKLKTAGHPWTTGKVFVDSAVVGPFFPTKTFTDWEDEPFQFLLNGNLKQEGRVKQMTFSPAECVSFVSHQFPLCDGDIIFTGTPKGVGELKAGQRGNLNWGKITYSVKWVADESPSKT